MHLNMLSVVSHATNNAAASADRHVQFQLTDYFFRHNEDIAAIVITDGDRLRNFDDVSPLPATRMTRLVNGPFFATYHIETTIIDDFIALHEEAVAKASSGETLLLNASPLFKIPVLAMMFRQEHEERRPVIVFFSSRDLNAYFGNGTNPSYMLNRGGDLLINANENFVIAGENYMNRPYINQILRSKNEETRQNRLESNGAGYLAAFNKLAGFDTLVVTMIPESIVFEGINATTRRNIYISVFILFAAALVARIFSQSLSRPIRTLTQEAKKIESGNFKIDIKAKSRDEIGFLTESFAAMSHGLETFGHFTNMEIARKAMSGELHLGGEEKTATIFFSDIRSFTELSENLDPANVVEFLNDYFSRMVGCVNKTHGIVDKFIGDAVMAVWGSATSTGNAAYDAFNCVRCALLMRSALNQYNQTRRNDWPKIKIGCGINTGEVTSGQIGSNERMEYTVIGDAVNLASRTEALNKPLGTDILITENTWLLVKNYFITEEMPPVNVKGKAKPVRMFAVVNMRSKKGVEQSYPRTLSDVRQFLDIQAPDLSKVNTSAEEKKYKIGGD
jgi:adenylate cyclase